MAYDGFSLYFISALIFIFFPATNLKFMFAFHIFEICHTGVILNGRGGCCL